MQGGYMRSRIYPEYYIVTNDGIRTQVDAAYFFEELKRSFPNPEEILEKLKSEDSGITAEGKCFFVKRK
jgi:hypothetical protein